MYGRVQGMQFRATEDRDTCLVKSIMCTLFRYGWQQLTEFDHDGSVEYTTGASRMGFDSLGSWQIQGVRLGKWK